MNKKEKIANTERKYCQDNIGNIIISENVFRHSGRMSITLMGQEKKEKFIQAVRNQWVAKLYSPVSDLLWSLQVLGSVIDLNVGPRYWN